MRDNTQEIHMNVRTDHRQSMHQKCRKPLALIISCSLTLSATTLNPYCLSVLSQPWRRLVSYVKKQFKNTLTLLNITSAVKNPLDPYPLRSQSVAKPESLKLPKCCFKLGLSAYAELPKTHFALRY